MTPGRADDRLLHPAPVWQTEGDMSRFTLLVVM